MLQKLQAEFAAQDPLVMFPPLFGLTCPTLLLHGTWDWLCPPVVSQLLAAEVQRRQQGPPLTAHQLPDLDHWLIPTRQWRSPAEQQQAHWRLDSGAVEILINWVQKTFAA